MKQQLLTLARRLSAWVQSPKTSYRRHNQEYEESGKLERERAIAEENFATNALAGGHWKLDQLLSSANPKPTLAVDIGAGTGWTSALLAKECKSVLAIEPSRAALEIARKLYPSDQYDTITWQEGFAEKVLAQKTFTEPVLFVTGCVLSHLRDRETKQILEAVTKSAPVGSLLCFSETWGDSSHAQIMWHIRTKAWWQENLPGWQLAFVGDRVPGESYYKGFWGTKTA